MSGLAIQIANSSQTGGSLPNLIARVLLSLVGSALGFSAFGLWLVPGNGAMPELSLIKLGLSLFLLIAGMCCVVCARNGRG